MNYIIRKRLPGKEFNFSDFLFATLRECDDIKIIDYVETRPKSVGAKMKHNLAKAAQAMLPPSRALMSQIFSKDFVSALNEIGPDDKVLIFDIWNLKLQLLIKKWVRTDSVKSFIWDSVSAFYRTDAIKKKYVHAVRKLPIFTFDPDDAARYDFGYAGQVYRCDSEVLRRCQAVSDADRFDLLYVGQDLGRTEMFCDIIGRMKQQEVDFHFKIVPPKKAPRCQQLEPYYLEHFMPYDKIIDEMVKCRCILEVTKPRQAGWTLRTLEALFYDKKLITTNTRIIYAPFYNSSNIYVIGDEKERRTLREFIDEPMVPVSFEQKCPYMIENWVRQFFR